MVLSDSYIPSDINPLKPISSHPNTSSTTRSLNEYNVPSASVEKKDSLLNTRIHKTRSHDVASQNNPSSHNNNNNIVGSITPPLGNIFNIDIVIAIHDYNLFPQRHSLSPSPTKASSPGFFRSSSISAESISSASRTSHYTDNDSSGQNNNKLSFQKGDTIYVLKKLPTGWWDGIVIQYPSYSSHYNYNINLDSNFKVIRGWFPNTFIKLVRENVSCIFRVNKSKNDNLDNNINKEEEAKETIIINLPIPAKHRNNSITSTNNTINNFISSGNGGITSRKNSSNILLTNYSRHNSTQSSEEHSLPNNEPSTTTTKRGSILSTNHTKALDEMIRNDNMYSALNNGRKPSIKSSTRSDSKSDTKSIKNKNEKIKILSLEEVEMIISSLHSPISSTWNPVPLIANNTDKNIPQTVSLTTNLSNKIIYYNKELDIYCSEFPLVSVSDNKSNACNSSVSSLSESSNAFHLTKSAQAKNPPPIYFPSNDHLIDLRPRNLSDTVIVENANDSVEKITTLQPPINTKNPTEIDKNLKEDNISSIEGPKNIKEGDNVSPQNTSFYRRAIMAKPGLFYYHQKDIKTWIELEDLTLYYIKLTHNMILKNDYFNFKKFMAILSNMFIFTQLVCRLVSNEIQAAKCDKKIKSLLKKLINSLSRINLNALVYFDNSEMNFNQVSKHHENLRTSVGNTTVDSLKDRNLSTSTAETLIARTRASMESILSPNTKKRYTSITGINENFNGKHISHADALATMIRNLFESIDQDFFKLIKNVELLHKTLQSSILNKNEFQNIPQILPRFFQVSFSGGSWTNPFSKFMYPSESTVSNATSLNTFNENNKLSTDESKRSSNTALPLKMANAIALAAGVNIPKNNINSNANKNPNLLTSDMLDSSDSDILKSVSLVSLSSLSTRYSHFKTFTRSKRFKKKTKYPLNSDTLITMKKIANEIQNTFNIKETDEYFISEAKKGTRTLHLNSKTYEQLNQNTTLIEIMENLDLTIFVNLKQLIKQPNMTIDHESKECLKHAMFTIGGIIGEFYSIKQTFHNILISLIMSAQQTTLNDPYIFSPMRPNHPIDFNEPIILERIQLNKHAAKLERKSKRLLNQLIKEDVEFNNINFLDDSEDFLISCEKYVEIASLSCKIVEHLIEERENLINYATRMMKNDLTAELLKGEQNIWFDYSSDSDSDDSYIENREDDDNIKYEYKKEGTDSNEKTRNTSISLIKKSQGVIASNKKIKHNYDIEWYLQSEHDFDLIYDNRDQVKGGTKEALIEHLTSHEVIDPSFNVTMLISFRSMMTTKEFLYELIYRYNLYPPEELNYDEYTEWIENKLNPIKCRVIYIMKTFLQHYWNPCYLETGLSSLEEFAQLAIHEGIPGADDLLAKIKEKLLTDPMDHTTTDINKDVKKILNKDNQTDISFKDNNSDNLKKDNSETNSNINTNVNSSNNNSSFFFNTSLPLIKSKKLKLLNIESHIFATQLTIMEHELYLRISMFECLDRAWGNKYGNMGGSVNISKFIMNANHLTNYISYSIVKQTDIKKRSKYIQYFITVAQHCKELNNYSSMTAIISALYSSPVYRLKNTWKTVPRNYTKILSALNNLMDSKKNFSNYRAQLRGMKDVACVPFFGIYLSDLTFIAAGNSDYLHRNKDIINFSKRIKIVDIIEEILSFQHVHYKLKRFDDIQTLIETSLGQVPHIEVQYQLSLKIEPRTNNSTNMINLTGDNKNLITEK
ncbi:hypothetical protein RI543_000040 [Arxiozyma heterogenica]|uniref:Cell division control protein 25 n=1 Tax=Arxiozyma heterogenica TaxID=278026 RepID=A0AAN8A9R5_9SACH|nr:hypothetical protein RI543_000040 [Kazachstania heterogenica]